MNSLNEYLIELSHNFTPNSVLDIGANIGEVSSFCKDLWPNSNILMIEANQYCQPYLLTTNIPFIIATLSDRDNLKVPFYFQPDNLIGTGASYYIEQTQWYNNPIVEEKITTTLDTLTFQTYDIVKIDTQGSELDIIKGGPNLISKASYVILELSIKEYNKNAPSIGEVIVYMQSIGFDHIRIIEALKWPRHDGLFKFEEIIQVNAVFTKS